MKIRKAEDKDIKGIMNLLHQVNDVHADGRPDLFIHGCSKYTPEELQHILSNPNTPVFINEDEDGNIAGYCFCIVEDHKGANNLTPIKTLYIDDLCVDENIRGRHIGRNLYDFVTEYARTEGFYNVTLNVWSCNPGAIKFYEALGMKPYKIGMETIL